MLNDSGHVIGVVTLKAADKEGLGFCIPLSQVRDATQKVGNLSSAKIQSAQSQHSLRVVSFYVMLTGGLYKAGMETYTSTMDAAIKRGIGVNVGLEVARSEVHGKLAAADKFLIGDLKREVSRITIDHSIPEATRQRFIDLWTNYLEMKSYIDDPRGNFVSYRAKYQELSDKHERFSEAMKLLLGVESEQ